MSTSDTMDDAWDDVSLALDVSRLRRACKARASRQARASKRAGSAQAALHRQPPRRRSAVTRKATQKHSRRKHSRLLKPATTGCTVVDWANVRFKSAGPPIHVGTECSGLESVMVALDHMGLGRRAQLCFVCKKDAAAQKFILAHRSPEVMFTDITERSVNCMPTCDIYAVSFPGLGQVTHDKHGRGLIFPHILDYVRKNTPKAFILENVKDLTMSIHRESLNEMLAALRADALYAVTGRVVNTANFGLPQHRPRVYIIGLRRSALVGDTSSFNWPRPAPTPCTNLEAFLERDAVRKQPTDGTTAAGNIKRLKATLAQQGINVSETVCALDIFASNGRAVVGKVPCLTRRRAGAGGYWLTSVNGLLTTHEMLRLQGLPDSFSDIARKAGIRDRQLRLMIGNATSVNVLVCLLSEILQALGFK